jgi:hypothetical protein
MAGTEEEEEEACAERAPAPKPTKNERRKNMLMESSLRMNEKQKGRQCWSENASTKTGILPYKNPQKLVAKRSYGNITKSLNSREEMQ